MADYTGKRCDSCKQLLNSEDDIVVCPVCGTPHHRECWQELGRCVNEERHAEGFDWAAQSSYAEQGKNNIICPKCHRENDPDALFCTYCSNPLVGGYQDRGQEQNGTGQGSGSFNGAFPPFGGGAFRGRVFTSPEEMFGSEEINGVKAYKIAEFVRMNPLYYVRKFKELCSKGKKISTNWAACFLSYVWWFARKNYLVGTAVALVNLVMTFILYPIANEFNQAYEQFINSGSVSSELASAMTPLMLKTLLGLLAMLAVNFVISLFANRIYMDKVFSSIKLIEEQNLGKEEENYEMARKGGLSFSLAALSYFGFTLASNLATVIVDYIKQLI